MNANNSTHACGLKTHLRRDSAYIGFALGYAASRF